MAGKSMTPFRCAALALLAFLALARAASAEWQVVSSTSEPSTAGGVEHRHVEASEANGSARATLDLAVFSTKTATLRVLDNPAADDSLAETMRRENCLAGVNGGYFDPEYAPVGLLISDGRMIAPQRRA